METIAAFRISLISTTTDCPSTAFFAAIFLHFRFPDEQPGPSVSESGAGTVPAFTNP